MGVWLSANICAETQQHFCWSTDINRGTIARKLFKASASHSNRVNANVLVTRKKQMLKKSFFQQEPTVRRTFVPPGRDKTNCTSCVDRELYLNFTKEEIRKEILRKLDLKEPPNVSVDAVPKHLIKQLLDRYRHDLEDSVNIMNDDPSAHFNGGGHGHFASYEEDDYHFQTRQINMLAQNRK